MASRVWALSSRLAIAICATATVVATVPAPSARTPVALQPGGAARLAAAAAVDPAVWTVPGSEVPLVVQTTAGHAVRLADEVVRLGGRVTRALPIVGGLAATVPAAALEELAATPGVTAVSLDRRMHVQASAAATGRASAHQRETPRESAYQEAVRADDAWADGLSGRGSTVALIDTGVADVPQLSGRIVTVTDRDGHTSRCQNFSGEDGCGDSYGHGTFLAGIIAGDGGGSSTPSSGIAPGARLLSVKVAGRDGATDVSTVLAAIQWVVSFRGRYDVRVLNLSLGTDSTQSYRVDPLNYAVERAWSEGIVVVVSAANRGPAAGTVTKPGDDPFVVTVGAVDDHGTRPPADDALPDFSSRGPTSDGFVKPDLVAPGAHLSSLRAVGSLIDERFPPGDGPYRLGSGTSMAAAVVSGVVALVLQARPGDEPDEVKHALRSTARPVASDDENDVGAGLVDAYAAAREAPGGAANAGLRRSNGLGALGLSRGSLDLGAMSVPRVLLTGTMTAQLLLWDPVGYTLGAWTASTWYTSVHGLVTWHNVYWAAGDNWGGDNWGGSSWYGSHDASARYGTPGPASNWYGAWG